MKVSVVNGLPVARAQQFIVPKIAFTPTVRLYLYTSAFQFFGLIYLCMYWDMAAVLHCHIDETTARAKFHDPTDVDLTSSADFVRCERKTVDGFYPNGKTQSRNAHARLSIFCSKWNAFII